MYGSIHLSPAAAMPVKTAPAAPAAPVQPNPDFDQVLTANTPAQAQTPATPSSLPEARSAPALEPVPAVFRDLRDLPQRIQDVAQRHQRELAGQTDPARRVELMHAHSEELLGLQARLHEVHFQVELVAKIVEQATSGARTILQTPA